MHKCICLELSPPCTELTCANKANTQPIVAKTHNFFLNLRFEQCAKDPLTAEPMHRQTDEQMDGKMDRQTNNDASW